MSMWLSIQASDWVAPDAAHGAPGPGEIDLTRHNGGHGEHVVVDTRANGAEIAGKADRGLLRRRWRTVSRGTLRSRSILRPLLFCFSIPTVTDLAERAGKLRRRTGAWDNHPRPRSVRPLSGYVSRGSVSRAQSRRTSFEGEAIFEGLYAIH
jgi:hypothetical protein